MQLKKIRLAGFKSFVDPTTVPLPGRCVGVVGPNGCGKSNLIDAVRWVMGESSAKHLRGESSTDVIFNGSSERAPVGQASIELIFDNTDGAIGGQYAAYNEISVRRQVNREGQSFYALNGTRCRRRDIRDIFLGTGIQPRGYSIIEQGMISRVIESRPEELRTYLEEAAGISLYKERRRETERRIRDTRENLQRLTDLREEVSAQLAKTQRQAEVAERYRALKEQERRQRAEATVLRLRDLDLRREELEGRLRELETQREAALAEQRRIERELETLRERSTQRHEELHSVQGRYYEVGGRVANLEQRIQSERELRESRSQELEQVTGSLEEVRSTREEDLQRIRDLEEEVQRLEPALEAAREREEQALAAYQEAQEAMARWREQRDAVRREAEDARRRAELERMREQEQRRRMEELGERLERLGSEIEGFQESTGEEAIAEARDEVAAVARELEEWEAVRREAGEALSHAAERRDEVATALDQSRESLAAARARLGSLQTLQEAALGRDSEAQAEWVAARGWGDAPRLAERIEVEAGWEHAVETVLGDAVQALCLERAEEAVRTSERPPGAAVTVVAAGEPGASGRSSESRLAERVQGPAVVTELLAGVHCARDLAAARDVLPSLPPGESVITPDGTWLGRTWVRLPMERGGAQDEGVLERERALEAAGREVAVQKARVEEQEEALRQAREEVATAEARRDEAARALEPLTRRHGEAEARVEHLRQRREAERARLHEAQEERDRIRQQRADAEEQRAEAAAAAQRLEAEAEDAEHRLAGMDARAEEHQRAVEDREEALREAREARYAASGELERAQASLASVREQLRRDESQYQRLEARRSELQQALDEAAATAELERERDALLQEQASVEEQLTELRRGADDLDHQFREQDRQRTEAEQRAETLRESVEALRLEVGEVRVLRDREAADLARLEVDEATIREGLPDGASVEAWSAALAETEEAISRLGAVNLAAIEESRQLEERQQYLDEQYQDLTAGLETLENAIRRIDRETRARFRDTFEQVNQGLSRFFPRLFGGGRAYLEMTDDDLLQTGVTVLAQPPGKRISSIHQLSGGEKALTAVALVFAIFHLNPAPFCLLDEVDAPLDEANVGRFFDLVEEMSEKVQFLLITHNKTTMERVSHLLGVTMNEPGVSRLVAVDVDEAATLAEAG